MKADPYETDNLASDPQRAALVKKLYEDLKKSLRRMDDPAMRPRKK